MAGRYTLCICLTCLPCRLSRCPFFSRLEKRVLKRLEARFSPPCNPLRHKTYRAHRLKLLSFEVAMCRWLVILFLLLAVSVSLGVEEDDQSTDESDSPDHDPADDSVVPHDQANDEVDLTLTICCQFMNGRCGLGARCHYRHIVTPGDHHPDTPCFYLPFGSCFYGEHCLYRHDPDVVASIQPILPTSSPRPVCRYFLAGMCTFGENCHYRHVQDDVPLIIAPSGDTIADDVIHDYYQLGTHMVDVNRTELGSGTGRDSLPSYDPDEVITLGLQSVTASGGLCRLVRSAPPVVTDSFIHAWAVFMAAARVLASVAGWAVAGAENWGLNLGAFPVGQALYFHGTSALCALAIAKSKYIKPNIAHRRGAEKGDLGRRNGKRHGTAWAVINYLEAVRWSVLVDLGIFSALVFHSLPEDYKPLGWFIQLVAVVHRDCAATPFEGGWVASTPLPVVGYKIHLILANDAIGRVAFPSVPGGFIEPDDDVTPEAVIGNPSSSSSSSGIARDADGRPLDENENQNDT